MRLRLPFRRRVQIALDVMTALQFLHVGNKEKKIQSCFHRDVKSANIVLKQDQTAQLIDCGLAKFVLDDNILSSDSPKGTPGYICHEYSLGAIQFDQFCDIFSFGVVLVELWTGKIQNHRGKDGNAFNFVLEYIPGRSSAATYDIETHADPTFGFPPSEDNTLNDTLPHFMVRFAHLAMMCMEEHKRIPDGDKVMSELHAILSDCASEDVGTSSGCIAQSVSQEAAGRLLCERCQSFQRLSDGSICRMCFDSEEKRDAIQNLLATNQRILSLLLTNLAKADDAATKLDAFGALLTDANFNIHSIGTQMETTNDTLDAIRLEANATRAEINATATEVSVVRDKLDSIHSETLTTNTKLGFMAPVLGNLDAQFTNVVPRLFYIVPSEQKNAFLHPREYLKGRTSTKYYLYFVCSHTRCLVDAPIKIRLTKDWVKRAAPVLAVSLQLLRSSLSFVGIQLNLEGFAFQVTTAVVDAMFTEMTSMMANLGSYAELLSLLSEKRPLNATDVPELRGEVYHHIVERASEQSEWRELMEPVRTATNPATLWVTKDVACNPNLRYVRAC